MSSSHQVVQRSSDAVKRIKVKGSTSSKGTSRSKVPIGLPSKKAKFFRRGSPRKRHAVTVGLPPSGETDEHGQKRLSSWKKSRASSRRGNGSEGYKNPTKLSMRALSWNCQRIGSDLTARRLMEMCQKHRPRLVFLSDTKNRRLLLQNIQADLRFDRLFTVEPLGLSGGFALFSMDEFQTNVLFPNNRMIDVEAVIDGIKVFMMFFMVTLC